MKILSICSARPNFVKLAAVHHALKKHSKIKHVIVHTGQHYDPLLSDVFFEQLKIPQPDENLGIHGGNREEVITNTTGACVTAFRKHKPDWVLVYGDVNGALGAAQAAKELGIKLAHVEAGLRSFDSSMPEEHNRIAIDDMADLLLVSERSGIENLEQEERTGRIELVGNTMIDTLIRMLPLIEKAELPFTPHPGFAVATIHRPSNVDDMEKLLNVMGFLGKVAKHVPQIILPMHPRFRQMIEKPDPDRNTVKIPSGVTAIDPLGYLPFLRLAKDSAFILTDSGGIQEEATFLKKKCFTLRKNTERPSTLEIHGGSNTLIDLDNPGHRKLVLDYAKKPKAPKVKVPELWDGKAGERIAAILAGD